MIYPDGSTQVLDEGDFKNRYAIIRITRKGNYTITTECEGRAVPYILRSLPDNRAQNALPETVESAANKYELGAGDYLFSLLVEPFRENVSLCVSEENSPKTTF
jgi:hypothetical protein